jgi:hypothetical protein
MNKFIIVVVLESSYFELYYSCYLIKLITSSQIKNPFFISCLKVGNFFFKSSTVLGPPWRSYITRLASPLL